MYSSLRDTHCRA